MAYRGLTAIGANYLATRLAQELPVEFTKVQIGAGTPVGNPSDVTNLQNYKLDAKILKKSQENNTVEITIQVVNDNIDQGFYLKEIGVFVNDDTEKLYWYCNEDNAQYIPAKTDSAIAFEIDIKMEVTNVESPILNWSGQGTWIDKKYLESELIKKIDKGGYSGNAKNLDDDIKKRLIQGTIPNSLDSAEKIIQALQGNGGLKFDESLLYLNDAGTKKKGFYYLDKLKNGIFECLEQTTTTVNDSSKFKDISNKSNSDRLDNLCIKKIVWEGNVWLGEETHPNTNIIIGKMKFVPKHHSLIFINVLLGGSETVSATGVGLLYNNETGINRISVPLFPRFTESDIQEQVKYLQLEINTSTLQIIAKKKIDWIHIVDIYAIE